MTSPSLRGEAIGFLTLVAAERAREADESHVGQTVPWTSVDENGIF